MIAVAINNIRPNASFRLVGSEYAGLEWLDENQIKPTEAEIEDELRTLTDAKVLEDAKDARTKELDELVITHNTVAYDANGKAIGNMSAVMGVANFKALSAMYDISRDMIDEDSDNYIGTEHVMYGYCMMVVVTYEAVYKSKIGWKGADNEAHEVQIESVCEALEKSMLGVSDILGL